MKVVEPGRPQAGLSKELKCTGYNGELCDGNKGWSGCGATLLVSEYNLYYAHGAVMSSESAFTCPQCGVETTVRENETIDPKGKRPSKRVRREIATKNRERAE
jgi:hypothetical protein